MNAIKIEILSNVSRSKGWGRFAILTPSGAPIIASATGNEWMSGDAGRGTKEGTHEGEMVIKLQTSLSTGKGHRNRDEITTVEYRLVAAEGEVTELSHRPGSQGVSIRITGARNA